TGTATDNSDGFQGAAKSVYFRLKDQASGNYFNFISSAYLASAANCTTTLDNTCAPAAFTGGSSYQLLHGSLTNSQAFVPNQQYIVELIVKDRAGNPVAATQKTFTWDVTPPVAGILQPVVTKPVNGLSLAQLNGTAADAHAIKASSFSIESKLTGKCFNPANSLFSATCPNWVVTSSNPAGTAWSFSDPSLSAALLTYSSTWYVLLARGLDSAGNLQSAFSDAVSSRTFLFDKVPPQTAVSFPAHNGNYKPSAIGGGTAEKKLQGTVSDPEAPWNSAIRKAEIRISYLQDPDTYYWQDPFWSSGTAVVNTGYFATDATDSAWEYLAVPAWAAAGVQRAYKIESRAEDDTNRPDGTPAGNYSTATTPGTDIRNFVVDDSIPTFALQAPAATEIISLAAISGTANADLAGLSEVAVRLQRIGGGADEDWTGSSWTALNDHYSSASLSGVTGSVNWSYADLAGALLNAQQYRIFLRLRDRAGNERSAPAGGDYDFIFDDIPPSLSISVPYLAPSPSTFTYANGSNADTAWELHYASGPVSDGGAFTSGVTQVWVAIASGAPTDSDWDWWNEAGENFSLTDNSQIQWTTQVYTAGSKWTYQPA
ncbi:MAG: hypothetical protein AABX98_02095, partial [Nanoarchaeota archaeon]